MIHNIQIAGDPDLHPERPVHDARELALGQIEISKLKVSGHFVRIFDLMDDTDRESYEKLYVELDGKVKAGSVFVAVNSRELLTRKDGSTGWFRYIEWTEFDTSGILGA